MLIHSSLPRLVFIGVATIGLCGSTASGILITSPVGTWPRSWPKELEPFRARAETQSFAAGMQQDIYEIRFTNREEFEKIWPALMQVKSKGAPIILRRVGQPSRDATGRLRANTRPAVRIVAPPAGLRLSRPGAKDLQARRSWPTSVRSTSGLLPKYVARSKDGSTWVSAENGNARGFFFRCRIDIELVVDGQVINLSRIRWPPDTPIVDRMGAFHGACVVQGTVTDAESGTALANARVRIVRHRAPSDRRLIHTASSNARGEFAFIGLATGDYAIHVDAPGYIPQKRTYVTNQRGAVHNVAVRLIRAR